MKKILKRGLSLVLALVMVTGLLPVTAFAAVDNATGMPKDVNNTLVLAIYTGTGFPGEPAVYGTENYKNINSSFTVRSGATFASTANNQLDWSKIKDDIVQGSASGNTYVWGVYDANGTKDYFLENASIIQPANEAKIIRAIKDDVKDATDEEVLNKYEIIWYVIKMQHSPSSWWWSSGTSEWHIDGIIKEKQYISINYYGNGNTYGNAPLGVTNHTSGKEYTIQGKNNMTRTINGVEVAFLGWSAKADGTGEEAGFYQPGDVIKPTQSLSLYAMWDTTTQYTATVSTYLDGKLTSDSDIHGKDRVLSLSTDGKHFYDLTEGADGVYTTKITGNGKFLLYTKNADGTYTQSGNHQLTIYNQNGSLDIHHYSVTYDPNQGAFEEEHSSPAYAYSETVTATDAIPVREGYRFLGWQDAQGKLIQPGEEVTASITAPVKLTAQWEKTINVTVNVTINHEGGGGYDQMATKDDVSLALVSRADENSPYLEVEGKTLNLGNGTVPEEQKVTQYIGNTFADMPGGKVGYTVVTSKSGYDTKVTERQDAEGNWIIDVVMTYNPSNFDLEFTVEVDESVPERYIPDAAIVKVTFWSTDRKQWEIITQQEGGAPGVRVDLDATTRSGSGSYPVWKYESNGTTPYGYRIEITSFVYPDGTIVPASQVVTKDTAWSDNVYTATVDPVTGGMKFGTLDGAYIGANGQMGELNAVITMDLHNVTFDAQGGKVNGKASQTETKQYKIPEFKNYVPTREGGYTFEGWYVDQACTVPAEEGKDLTQDITLYAKWKAPLTVSGTVTVSGSYQQNDDTVYVHDIDRATQVYVVLQELREGRTYEVDSQLIDITYGADKNGTGEYSFEGIPDDGKEYRIELLMLNYGTSYDNESDEGISYSAGEYNAVFGDDKVADVDSYLEFVPPSYTQTMKVDATQIAAGFRPKNVLSEIIYRDVGDNHPYQVISQHTVPPKGVQISLNNGVGEGTESIWKWHTDGTLYDYQMSITQVDGAEFDSDTAPYYISYAAPAYWNSGTGAPSGDLLATLIPKQYPVTFLLNAGDDAVTGMDEYKQVQTDTDEAGNTTVTSTYTTAHTWSFDTAITAVPQREGYTFLGWTANADGVYADGKIPAEVYQDVTLTAQWERNSYTVTTVADPDEGGDTSGDNTYLYGEQATVTAVTEIGFHFGGWYENGDLVSEEAVYTFTVDANRELTARFARNPYNVNTLTTGEGTVSGAGIYEYGQTATVTATAKEGHMFQGWYEGAEKISDEASYSFTVTADRTLTAHFSKVYTITTIAETGGTVSGGGRYVPNADVTITAAPNSNYYFVGWYNEKDELVTAERTYKLSAIEDRAFTAKFERKVAYRCDYVYIFGYQDTQIGATGPLLRSELAQMIYRLVVQNKGSAPQGKVFSDTSGQWYQKGIAFMEAVGAINGNQQNAYPYGKVTRGETYKMICLGLGFTTDAGLNFSEYATILRNSGYLNDDGRVTATIQRWEFCQLFNAILGRTNYCPDGFFDAAGNEVTAATYGYTDLKPEDDYYRIMMIATSTFIDSERVDVEGRAKRNDLDFGG